MVKRGDVIYAHHMPLKVGVAASLSSWVRSIAVEYDIQYMWPNTLRATHGHAEQTLRALALVVCVSLVLQTGGSAGGVA